MSPTEIKLQEALGAGYRALVLKQIPLGDALHVFNCVASDDAVMDAAKAELKRAKAFDSRRCFMSATNANFLKQAIEQFAPVTVVPENSFLSHQDKEEDMTSKLSALAGLAKTTVAQVEADADAAVKRLVAAKDKAHGGIDKLNGVTSTIESGAGELEDFASQITNGGPPLSDR